MDPYLEMHWGDVHTSMITYARDQLRAQMPPGLRVRVEEYVAVEGGEVGPLRDRAGETALVDPLVIPMATEAPTLRSIRIVDTRSGNRILTAIELLSPSNKVGTAARAAYREKQQALLQGSVSLVEIDLLRAGEYVLAVPESHLPPAYRQPYRICVVRASRPDRAEAYRASMRQRLPMIAIPLRPADADARLDLQDLVERAYENGDYQGDIDYRSDPVPRLKGADAEWAAELLEQEGLR